MKKRTWKLKEQSEEEVKCLCNAFPISPIVAKLLINREQNTPEKASVFLCKAIDTLGDPLQMKDMDKAVARIEAAVKNKEKVTVYGDYDVDGVTSTAILYRYLKERGLRCSYYIPDRTEEGYGINNAALDSIVEGGTTLLITVDSGITAIEEIAYAKTIGLDVVVTDHHECKEELPDCAAVVNPKRRDCPYPFQELAGVGVVLKLICALEGRENLQSVIDRYCELAAFGTIADVMPLRGENRVLVSLGLSRMNHTKNIGLSALMERAGLTGKKVTAGSVSFALAPRINAAGRMGCATRSVELFLTEDRSEAAQIAGELCEVNRLRQEEENGILEQAKAMIQADPHFAEKKIIVLAHENWHHGVIGIVASRLADQYYLPCILISLTDGIGKGSGRSVGTFNLYEALEAEKDYLMKFGGHALAAGLTIAENQLTEFRERMEEYAATHLTAEMLAAVTEIDCELSGEEVNLSTVKDIYFLEPYGMGNPTPVFLLADTTIIDYIPLSGGKHMKMTLQKDGKVFCCMCFGRRADEFPFLPGERIDLVAGLDVNRFRGEESVQVAMRDVRISAAYEAEMQKTAALYRRHMEGEILTPAEAKAIIPSREDFVTVFRLLGKREHKGKYQDIYRKIELPGRKNFNLGKFLVCLTVFQDSELLHILPEEEGVCLKVCKSEQKKNLDLSKTLIALKTIRMKSGT